MYGFHPEKFKNQPKGDAPKLGFKPRQSAPADAAAAELPSSVTPGRGFRPREAEPVTTDVLPGLGFQPHKDALRAQAQNQAPDSIPAMMKPGEFVLPPDTVHAMGGKEALQGVVDATHAPAPDAAIVPRGFKPRAYFAQGGAPEDEQNRRLNSFGDAAAATSNPGTTQVAAPAAGPSLGYSTERDRAVQARQAAQQEAAQRRAEVDSQYDSGAAQQSAQEGMRAVFERRQRSMVRPDRTDPANASLAPAPSAPAAAPAAASAVPPAAPVGQQQAAGQPLAASAPAAPAPAPAPNQVATGVYQHGRGQYSDQAGGMGFSPGFSGQPSAPNQVAAENMARGFRPGMGTAAREPGPGLGFGPGSELARIQAQAAASPAPGLGFQPGGVSAPVVRHSGNDWQSRNDLRNAEVSASSITNTRRWGGKGAENSPEVQAYQAALKNDLALQGAQPGVDVAAMRENAGIQREGMQQDGATQRAGLGFKTDQQRLDLERETQGYANRAAAQQEQLRAVLADPKASIVEKNRAQQALRAMAGKAEDNRFTVVPGGQEWDAQAGAMRNVPARVLNNQTGEFVEQQAGQGGAPRAPTVGTVEDGYRFMGGDPANPASWAKA